MKKIVKNVKKPISGILQDVKQTGKLLIKGSNDYPPNVKKIMTQYGNEIIKSMTLKRTPVSGLLTGALNVFSLGKFGKRMSKSFDELFHLFLEIQLQSGTRLLLEKNERINMEINPKERPDTQIKNIINVPQNLSINQLLETTKRQMGSQFFQYDAVKNNCQDFLLNVLKSNGIGNEQDYEFIKQDTEQLFKGLPALKKVAHLATELGERGNILLQGGALDNQLFSHTKNPSKVIETIRMLKKKKPLMVKGTGMRKKKMFEFFKGTGSVGKVANKIGYEVVSLDFDPIYTPDIETDILKWKYKDWYKEHNFIPDVIWASPPCNTFSPLAYRLKERNTKTAEPKSDRAKEGTKILHKTLEIINFFKSLNPNLKFVIENPRGMMRNDKKIKKIPYRATATYCSYGDKKFKPTDFWSNYEIELKDLGEDCKEYELVQNIRKIEDRYSIPSRLIKSILEQIE